MKFKFKLDTFFNNEEIILNLNNTSLPTSTHVYYEAKKKELCEQYETARMFLKETELNDYKHWFKKSDDEKINNYLKLTYESIFYETAILYYNIVVDLSWCLFYVSVEYLVNTSTKTALIPQYQPIGEAYDTIRQLEKYVTNPSDESAPYKYFSNLNKSLTPIFNHVNDFWKSFSRSKIRDNYNYIKHKGKPIYNEITDLQDEQLLSIIVNNEEIPSKIEDVQMKLDLIPAIDELFKFDNDILYPYIKSLIELLDSFVKPSKLIQ